jgi:hypothetical protein
LLARLIQEFVSQSTLLTPMGCHRRYVVVHRCDNLSHVTFQAANTAIERTLHQFEYLSSSAKSSLSHFLHLNHSTIFLSVVLVILCSHGSRDLTPAAPAMSSESLPWQFDGHMCDAVCIEQSSLRFEDAKFGIGKQWLMLSFLYC